jgi:acyl-CoA synthetase (AMP-forming)/AMP-acid ligase II
MATALARSIRTCLLRRSGDVVLTICAARAGQLHERLTGAALHRAALARGQALARAFDPADGPLALVMPCGSLFVETMIGALYAGFTIAPLARPRPGLQAGRFDAIIADCRPVAILCTAGLAPRLAEARRAAGGRDVPIVALAAAADAVPDEALPDCAGGGGPDRPAVLQYTSGSTRDPRGVLLHGDAILANAALANRTWGMDESGTMLSWLPHFHDMGLMGGILYPLLAGGATALMDPLRMIQRPDRWLQLIGELCSRAMGSRSMCSWSPAAPTNCPSIAPRRRPAAKRSSRAALPRRCKAGCASWTPRRGGRFPTMSSARSGFAAIPSRAPISAIPRKRRGSSGPGSTIPTIRTRRPTIGCAPATWRRCAKAISMSWGG